MNEFIRAAAQSVNNSESDVNSLRKIGEGGFNRGFEITMDNGIALPIHHASTPGRG
jgi:hypothetical protein